MIRYQLRCSRGHGFEGWFKNSDAYARDVEALDCPICGDRTIEKAIMAPAVLQRAVGREGGAPDTNAPADDGAATVGAEGAAPPTHPATAPMSARDRVSAGDRLSAGDRVSAADRTAARDRMPAGDRAPTGDRAPVAATPAGPVGRDQTQLAKAMLLMRKLRAHVEANFDNVGNRFAEEARKIHYAETAPRPIYGQASAEEVERLEDEGIEVAPLPDLPKLDG